MATVVAIYNDAVRDTTATYDYDPRLLSTQVDILREKSADGHAFVVAVGDDDRVVGFATYGMFRTRPGWRFTCEHSVYVDTANRNRGVGKALLPPIMAHARQRGFHVMTGVVDASNDASIALHRQLGFEVCGVMKQGGFKFGRWLDVAFVAATL